MNHFKKLSALLLAVIMMVTLASPVFAIDGNVEEAPHTITINNTHPNHEYSAYQIFKGVLAVQSTGTYLSDLQWGDNINAAGLLAALKADTNFGHGVDNIFHLCTVENPAGVAEVIKGAAMYQRIAGHIADNLVGAAKATVTEQDTDKMYRMEVEESGYYLVLDAVKADTSLEPDDSLSRYLMSVVEDTTIEPKPQSVPTVEKKVIGNNDSESVAPSYKDYTDGTDSDVVWDYLEHQGWRDTADHDIGDDVIYSLNVALPTADSADNAWDNYDNYSIILNDTLSKGLTVQKDSIRVFVGSGTQADPYREITEYVGEEDQVDQTGKIYTYSGIHTDVENLHQSDSAWTRMTVTINNIKAANINAKMGNHIWVVYKCTLNDDAKIGSTGNPNTVNMNYSNDPNHSSKGDMTTGKTVDDTNIVFTYSIDFSKVTATTKVPLDGADFRLDKLYESYEAVVKTDPTGAVVAPFVYYDMDENLLYTSNTTIEGKTPLDTNKTFSKVYVALDKSAVVGKTEGDVTTTASVFKYNGVDNGTYRLTETQTPAGFNSIEPIVFQINSVLDDAKLTLTRVSATGGLETESNNGVLVANIENSRGSQLPTTGGIGTTIFYVVGSVFVLAAGVMLITKKRVSNI